MKTRFVVLSIALVVMLAMFVAPAFAQDAMSASAADGAVCDSTLATLILVAEHDYDYLSHMMSDPTMMEMMPKLNFGQYQPLIDDIMNAMMEMEPTETMMTEEEMKAHDEMLAGMMMMDSTEAISAYEMGMGMEAMAPSTVLTSGDVAGEDPSCAAARADVEKFLLAHIITEMNMTSMESGK